MIFEGHPSWRAILGFYLKGIVVAAIVGAIAKLVGASSADVFLIVLVIIALTVLVGFVKRVATTYTITDRRLNIKRGIVSREIQETRLERVQNVNYRQTVYQRIMQIGDVDFDTAATDDYNFVFVGVADPGGVVHSVDQATGAAAAGSHGLGEAQPPRRPRPGRWPGTSPSSSSAPPASPGAASAPTWPSGRRRTTSNGQPRAATRRRSPAFSASSGSTPPETIEADVEDAASLAAMADAHAGRAQHGRPLHALRRAGDRGLHRRRRHYMDLTGEIPFVRRMIERAGERAEKAGVKIVNVSGFEALPPDLLVLLAAETARERWSEELATADLDADLPIPDGKIQRLRHHLRRHPAEPRRDPRGRRLGAPRPTPAR